MTINYDVVRKNLGTFTNAYGLPSASERLVEQLKKMNGAVERVGILLRDITTKEGLISCQFPVAGDWTRDMLWVPSDERELEAVPTFTTREQSDPLADVSALWKRLKERLGVNKDFFMIEEGGFSLRVHRSFRKRGVVERYFASAGYGFIRRRLGGVYFKHEWCAPEMQIEEGVEVSFIPIICRHGLQARAVLETAT